MSTFEELRKSIARITHCDENSIQMDTPLKSIKADSLHWVQIIVSVENALNIEIDIDKEKMQQLTTIADFVKYIDKK